MSNVAGVDNLCNEKCTGVITDERCEDDECCGGTYRGSPTYTVYSVGGEYGLYTHHLSGGDP